MATKLLNYNLKGTKSSSNQKTIRPVRRLKPELHRLSTFRLWKENTQCVVSPALLSKVGFMYTGKGDLVRCEACGLEIDSWKSSMDPKQEHMERNPQCQFVLTEREIFTKNVSDQAIPLIKSSFTRTHVLDSDYRGYMDHGGGGSGDGLNKVNTNTLPTVTTFLECLSTEGIDKARVYTFINWPSITPSAQDMSYAGWWYTNIADRVICIHCDVMFHGWNETDKPYEIHRLKSPQCFYVRVNEKRETNNRNQLPVANTTITDAPNGQVIVGAVHADYAMITRRAQTFQKWPPAESPALPSVDSFVEAGFFYTGEKTIVRCFYCNGALRNWQASDDPKIEHARWFPQCSYIRQFIGENLYQAIQRKNRELRAQQILQASSNGESNRYTPWTSDEIDRMVKARLDLPVVEKLRQEGYTMAIIRKVYEMQLKFKKDDFKSDVDLRIACLILDKQVKLINGNEANILVPQNWLKKFIEDQNREAEHEEIKSTQAPELQKIDDAKVIKPAVVVRPRITPKTEETLPCVLCLTTERQVACLPCGHLTSCVACGHSLKTCPICRAAVKAFVRIYT